jgi:hypothetical protein
MLSRNRIVTIDGVGLSNRIYYTFVDHTTLYLLIVLQSPLAVAW